MKIITNRKVETLTAGQIAERYSNLDSLNKDDVKAFQSWFNTNYARPPFANKPLTVDGVYGKLSKAAYDKYGAEFEKTQPAKKSGSVGEVVELGAPKKSLMDKFNELTTTKKALVIGGSAILLAGLVYLIIPKKAKK